MRHNGKLEACKLNLLGNVWWIDVQHHFSGLPSYFFASGGTTKLAQVSLVVTVRSAGILPAQFRELKAWPANLGVWLTRHIAIGKEIVNKAPTLIQPITNQCILEIVGAFEWEFDIVTWGVKKIIVKVDKE